MANTQLGPTAATVGKVAKLLEVQKELIAKLHDTAIEIDNLLGGKAGIAHEIKAVVEAFGCAWADRYAAGRPHSYVWTYARDTPHIKRLLKTLGLDELLRRIDRYIKSEDPFVMRSRHPFGLFVSGINSYAAPAEAPADLHLDAPTVADCKHVPRCTSDQQHTTRKMEDMRR